MAAISPEQMAMIREAISKAPPPLSVLDLKSKILIGEISAPHLRSILARELINKLEVFSAEAITPVFLAGFSSLQDGEKRYPLSLLLLFLLFFLKTF